MIPDLSTVGNIVQAVRLGLLPPERAIEVLREAGFTEAEAILRDLGAVS